MQLFLASQHFFELAAVDQLVEVGRAAHQRATHKHHRKAGPSRPHLQGIALAPHAEVAAVLQIMMRHPGRIKGLTRLLRKRIHRHSNDHHRVLRDRLLDLLHDGLLTGSNDRADRRVNTGFIQDGAGHEQSFERVFRQHPQHRANLEPCVGGYYLHSIGALQQ